MENTFYETLIAELSDEERPVFEDLLSRLVELDGNLDGLSDQDKQSLSGLAARHQVSSDLANQETLQADVVSAAETSTQETSIVSNVTETLRPMETEFGAYLLDNINEHLCQSGASTADAVRYAFHNRWMPENLKNRDVCENLYYRFIDDIDEANRSLKEQSPSKANNDIVVAVGLAWFTNLYRCYQLVEAEGEI
ncbi:MAG: hypothetical protein COA74_07575 [Gammaproteobacteria bacterium]|nr:MAG: hypothetical protein COA74_07575 [Gammaproteobacteria bacterium]